MPVRDAGLRTQPEVAMTATVSRHPLAELLAPLRVAQRQPFAPAAH
ncbi:MULTISPECIES: hypothetical protein [unclassified Burkholderia]|nr:MULTISPECIES: hypothetical protein [unclassified Burkholderia]